MQHKSFIYHGDNLLFNKKRILSDLSDLLEVPVSEVFNSEDVWEFDSNDLSVKDWDEVYNHFLYNPTGQYKVILFDNADKLSELLQNKLLKPIEDSKEYIKVIFNTTKGLLDTVVSRSFTINLVSDIITAFPSNEDELHNFFGVEEETPSIVAVSISALAQAIRSSESLLIESGLIKEKSKSLQFLSQKVQEIARLIILFEIESARVTYRTRIARQYLEVESTESNLYLLLLELEI